MIRRWMMLLTLTGAMAAVLALVTVAAAGVKEQAPARPADLAPYWWRSYGDGENEYSFMAMDGTADGGFILAGHWRDPADVPSRDLWVAKLDAAGEVTWQRRYDLGELEMAKNAHAVQQTSDGGYIVTAYLSRGFAYPAWLLKLDAGGHVVWQRIFAYGQPAVVPHSVQEVSAGGFIVVADGGETADGAWVARLDDDGNVTWHHDYYENANTITIPRDVLETAGGDFVVVGQHVEEDEEIYRAWAMKIDAAGTVLWSRRFIGGWLLAVEATGDGHFLAVGEGYFAGDGGMLVVKLDAGGMPVWQKIYGGVEGSGAQAIERTADDNFVVGGGNGETGRLLKIDDDGNVLWHRAYGDVALPDMGVTEGGQIALAGVNATVLKADEWGRIAGCGQIMEGPVAVTTTAAISQEVALTMETPALAITDTTAVTQDTDVASALVCSGGHYTVSGQVTAADETPLAGVVLSSTAGVTATTDAGGTYTVTSMLSGTYTLTPTLSGFAFSPLSRTVSVPPDRADVDFAARPLTYTVSGRVTTADGEPLAGVVLSSTAAVSAATNAAGTYTLTSLLSGTHTLTPTLPGYAFSPISRTVSVPTDQAGVDFTARPLTYTVSGRVATTDGEPLAGVVLSSTAAVSAATNAAGTYTLTSLLSGTHTLTPTLPGYAFSPISRTVSVPPDQAGVDFTARPLTYTVSGRLTDSDGAPLAGAVLSTTAGITATTDASGSYALTGLVSGAHTVTPTLAGYTFDPLSRTVSVPPNKDGQVFVGRGEERRWNLYLPLATRP